MNGIKFPVCCRKSRQTVSQVKWGYTITQTGSLRAPPCSGCRKLDGDVYSLRQRVMTTEAQVMAREREAARLARQLEAATAAAALELKDARTQAAKQQAELAAVSGMEQL